MSIKIDNDNSTISSDKLIWDAVVEGDVVLLQQLLERDPLILHRLPSTPLHNPLQLACRLGHLNFALELLRLQPDLSEAADPLATPLHLAARNGNLDLVKCLVTANPGVCFARDSQGRNPVHVAAVNNCLAVLDELTGASPAAARERVGGGRGDTIMHLCVKQGTLEALELVVEKVGNIAILNAGDEDGNTILHLAVINKQVEIVKFIVKEATFNIEAQSSDGYTAMDIVCSQHHVHHESESREIKLLLREAKASRYFSEGKYKKTKPFGSWVEQQRNTLMVVASLIATMAFQAGISPPVYHETQTPMIDAPSPAPVTNEDSNASYFNSAFIMQNTIGFVSSMGCILLMISGLPCRRLMNLVVMITMWVAITAMAQAYWQSLLILFFKGDQKVYMVKSIGKYMGLWMMVLGVLFGLRFLGGLARLAKHACSLVKIPWTDYLQWGYMLKNRIGQVQDQLYELLQFIVLGCVLFYIYREYN